VSDLDQPHNAPAPACPPSPGISLALTVLAVVLALLILASMPLGRGGDGDASTIVPPSRFAEMGKIFAPVSFSILSGFHYGDPPGLAEAETRRRPDPIPPQVLALDGRQVAVAGFMLPLDYDGTGVSEFLLNASYDMCYFGAPTRPNDFIVVRMSGGRRTEFVHTPIVVFGTLTVREERSRGRVVSLYTMEAEGVGFIPQ
jgi:hypothetical protein